MPHSLRQFMTLATPLGIADGDIAKSLLTTSGSVGKVTETYPGADGRIRTAAVKVKDRTYIRPVARLVQLPKLEDEETKDLVT